MRVPPHAVRDRGAQFKVEGRRETVEAGVRGARVAVKQMHDIEHEHLSRTRVYREANILGMHIVATAREIYDTC